MLGFLKHETGKYAGGIALACVVSGAILFFALPVLAEPASEASRGQDTPRAEEPRATGIQNASDELSLTDELLKKGWALFQDHKNGDAIGAYTQAISLDHQNARAFALRAWAFSRDRDKARALEDAEKAVALDPQLALAHKSLGYALIDSGEMPPHGQIFIAIGLDPRMAAAYSDRGVG